MNAPVWSLRPATYDDAPLLASIVLEATKHQGLWPPDTSAAEEQDWVQGFMEWSRECVDDPGTLYVIVVGGRGVGRLRTERDSIAFDSRQVPRVAIRGLQLFPAYQGQGVGTAIIETLQNEATDRHGLLDLGVEHANTGARRLYDRLGFVPIGRNEKEVEMRWTPPSGGQPFAVDTVTNP